MQTEYYGVKFYSINDWSVGHNLEKADTILESFNENNEYDNINKIIELYNIKKLIDNGAFLKTWDENKIKNYQEICSKKIDKVIGKFLNTIDDNNFLETSNSVCYQYYEDYWNLFINFKVYENISGQTFSNYLSIPDTALHLLLKHKKLVIHYGKEFAEILRSSEQTPRIIISQFLENHEEKYECYLPKEFSPSEFEEILYKYIHSESANMNQVNLISYAQSTKECPISDKLRLDAKRTYEEFWKNNSNAATIGGRSISVKFTNAETSETIRKTGKTCEYIYDIKWLTENLDYPTIFNNFRYVFKQFDVCWRSSLVSVRSQLGVFEREFFTRGKKDYIKGACFNHADIISTMQVNGYYRILEKNGIRLEEAFKWFFEEYLLQEFGATNFRFNSPSIGATTVENCRTIASEMEGALKQFCMYVNDGQIDRELFEISSEHIIFSNIPSLLKDKYAYSSSNNINTMQFYLFSDQSTLSYIEKTKNKYRCLFDLLQKEKIMFCDFHDYQKEKIEWLIKQKLIFENSNNYLELDSIRPIILKDLYNHDVICPLYYNKKLKDAVYEWKHSGDLKLEGSLFSKPEQDYLNYKLNKAVYSNGLDLRNKYAHSTYPEDENMQLTDYINLLKIMVLIITKINDEFCLRDDINKRAQIQ